MTHLTIGSCKTSYYYWNGTLSHWNTYVDIKWIWQKETWCHNDISFLSERSVRFEEKRENIFQAVFYMGMNMYITRKSPKFLRTGVSIVGMQYLYRNRTTTVKEMWDLSNKCFFPLSFCDKAIDSSYHVLCVMVMYLFSHFF